MNFLYILRDYYPLKNASGACIYELINASCKSKKYNKHFILCLSEKEKVIRINEWVTIFTICKEKRENKFQVITDFINYPIRDYEEGVALSALADNIIRNYDINKTVCVVNPIESLMVLQKLKIKYPKIEWIIYELDSISDLDNNRRGLGFIKWIKRLMYENKVYKLSDKIIHMKCHEVYFHNKRYLKYQKKMYLADFPMFSLEDNGKKKITISCNNTLLFSGALIKKIRNPEPVVNILCNLSKTIKVSVHFYSRGDYEEFLENMEKKYVGIVYRNGYIASEKLATAIEQADFLISIGNMMENMVPSKIFGYLSMRKPIIHFFCNQMDPCIKILGTYPMALLVDVTKDVQSNIKKIEKFINDMNGFVFEGFSERDFEMNRPEYTNYLLER